MLLYIHGFNSSPESYKAAAYKKWLAKQYPSITYEVPYLSPYPAEAITQLEALVESYLKKGETVGLVGSSLGGFYAAWLVEKYQLRAVLVNPAIRPFELLSEYIGENQNYHNDDHYIFEQKHVDQLRDFYVEDDSYPDKLLLMVQTGDEALNYREATAKYFRSQNIIEFGGDHGFQGFDKWFSCILGFLGMSKDPAV